MKVMELCRSEDNLTEMAVKLNSKDFCNLLFAVSNLSFIDKANEWNLLTEVLQAKLMADKYFDSQSLCMILSSLTIAHVGN